MTIREKINRSCAQLLTNDGYLIRNNLNERAITHKLAEHLQKQFRGWDVDCEYNRDADHVKLIHFKKIEENISNSDINGRTVYPDIIIHKRGTRNNLVVIEAKKDSNPQSEDIDKRKIAGYMHDLGYKHGVFIKFITSVKPRVKIQIKNRPFCKA